MADLAALARWVDEQAILRELVEALSQVELEDAEALERMARALADARRAR